MRTFCFALVFVLSGAGSGSAQTNPPWLRQMPTVERVTADIKGDNDTDTSARRSGAFDQLAKIVSRMALLQNRNENSLTPDEKRLIGLYSAASVEAWKPVRAVIGTVPPGEQRQKLYGYATDPGFRAELLDKFFPDDVRALYGKADAAYAKDLAAFRARQQQRDAERQAFVPSTGGNGATSDPATMEMRRCVASGRGITECLAEMFGNNIGIVAPPLAAKRQAPGLRLSGKYTGDASIEFPTNGDRLPEGEVRFGCGKLYAEPVKYSVINENGSVVLRLATAPAVQFTMNPDGSWRGPGRITLSGQIVVGYGPPSTQQVYAGYDIIATNGVSYDISDARTYTTQPKYAAVSVPTPILKPGSETCNLVSMSVAGAAAASTIREATGFQAVPPGLRMVGEYASPSGFAIVFHPESATVRCGESEAADSYSVVATGREIVVRLQHGSRPFALTLRSDGTLTPATPGSVTVNGRVMTGLKGTQPVFAPTPPVTCQLAMLSPLTR